MIESHFLYYYNANISLARSMGNSANLLHMRRKHQDCSNQEPEEMHGVSAHVGGLSRDFTHAQTCQGSYLDPIDFADVQSMPKQQAGNVTLA